ncbi:hypothetical protein IMCC3135_14115 [Granulosicoccus antarcticus IMCC3135]|uniref:Copper amine oxidase catalytic domain-containing protein n=2 Tax=Granulosicoccus TaxID=437504 RepID=A0A2Z2NT39_9GAMM|nr:hypothetical protein IMCC3135_14115 [Granulosicoccus antarcticus IMCC3135]
MRERVREHWLLLGVLSLAGAFLTTPVQAQEGECDSGRRIEHAFQSGATWSLCANVEEAHGLTISSASYRAPGDTLRSVIQEAHLGQLLLHYHDSTQPEVQIDPSLYQNNDDDSSDLLSMNTSNCEGQVLDVPGRIAVICSRIKDNGILAKYAQRPSIQSDSLELSSAFQRDTLTWTSSFTFAEDGQVRPAISLSGRASHTQPDPRFGQSIPADTQALTRATLFTTWRLLFNLDTPGIDRIEQFDFPLRSLEGNRRPMQVTALDTEQFLTVDRGNFRGWRIVDTTGAGYYLDPANNGFNYSNKTMPWAAADAAITAYDACERHASNNLGESSSSSSTTNCGSSLDNFVNAQSLQGVQPVLWYSQSRTLDPRAEDWPVIRDLILGFDLLPFDWTAASPFETNG